MHKSITLFTLGLTLPLAGAALANPEYRYDWRGSARAAFHYSDDDLLRKKYYRLDRNPGKNRVNKKDNQKKKALDRAADARSEDFEIDNKAFAW